MNAIEQQREELVASVQTLPGEVLHELADFIGYLRHKVEISGAEQPVQENTRSPYEILKESGFIGFAEGPADLSVNHKAYLEKYLTEKYDQH